MMPSDIMAIFQPMRCIEEVVFYLMQEIKVALSLKHMIEKAVFRLMRLRQCLTCANEVVFSV